MWGPLLFAVDHFIGTLSLREEVSSGTSVHSYCFITVTCLQWVFFLHYDSTFFSVRGTLFSEKCRCHISQILVYHLEVQILELDFALFSLTSHLKSSSWGLHQAVHLSRNPLIFFWAHAGWGVCQPRLLATVSWCLSHVTDSEQDSVSCVCGGESS